MPAANVSRRTAGEGPGHTARVYVSEESHCGIVPMNHSNKDGRLVGGEWGGKAADQGEHFPVGMYPTPSGTARVPRVGERADKRFVLAAIHLRQEPDALMAPVRVCDRATGDYRS